MKKNILYIVEDRNVAQFRYRVLNVMEATEKSERYEVNMVMRDKLAEVKLEGVDLVVILRQTAKDKTLLDFIRKTHEQGIKVLFDLDDLIFDYKDLSILMKATGSKNIFYWASYVFGIRRIAKRVDGFITTNEFLAGKLERSFKKPCAVILNSLNSSQVEIAEKEIAKKEHDGFMIGYFSGSPTHRRDLEMVEPEILKFLNVHEDAKFVMVGYMELSDEMKKMVEKKKVKIEKLVDYKKLIKKMAEVDVSIAPLVINDFTNSKSELKFFEAAVVETTTIASPTYAFSKAIVNKENGFLAKTGEWYEKLEYLYNNPNENRKIAKKARGYALKNYYGKKFLKEVEEAYELFG